MLSAFGKLFTATINRRLETYLQNENIILLGEEQAGFRKGYSTTDHIFVLTSLIDIYLSKSKKLFALFVDYKTAFDRISRSILWLKLVNNGINGKHFRIIYDLYKEAKSCIEYNGKLSPFFPCNIGVRQGENLSPLLYAIYVSDFSSHLGTTIKGLPYIMKLANNIAGDYMELYRKLFILLYADDTVILAESANDMQMALHSLKDYCSQNELTLNTSKSKVMVFSKGKIRNVPNLYYGNSKLEVAFEYTYFGIKMNYNGKFINHINATSDKGIKAMFALLRQSKQINLPIGVSMHVFDYTVTPVLLYSSEIWATCNYSKIESTHLKFLSIVYM